MLWNISKLLSEAEVESPFVCSGQLTESTWCFRSGHYSLVNILIGVFILLKDVMIRSWLVKRGFHPQCLNSVSPGCVPCSIIVNLQNLVMCTSCPGKV